MFSKRTEWKLTPNRFAQTQADLRSAGMRVLDLSVSNPTRAGFSFDEEAILGSLVTPEAMDYDPQPKGIPRAREAVARYYREEHEGYDVDPESLILTTSTSEAYSYIFRLVCNSGEELLVPKPSYPLFEFLADLEDVTLVPYPLLYDHGWQVDFPSLYKAVNHHTRGVVIVHPNNPTGSYVKQEEVASFNHFCAEYGLALIVDEVFLDYAHDGAARNTFALNSDVLTFTLSGLSKISGLPQMKIAWAVTSGPEERKAAALARLEVIADTYLSMNAPLQLATPTLLAQRKHIQPLMLDRIRTNLQELARQLSRQSTCERLEVEGGWYVVLRVPVTQSDEELAIDLLRKVAVLVHPGHFYDFSGDGYLVLSLITPAVEFREGVSRILQRLNS
jgi:aspartate/methionine/tyrosine aminotransferase